jgi:hypothetical protein
MRMGSLIARLAVVGAVSAVALAVGVAAGSNTGLAQRDEAHNAKVKRQLVGTWRLASFVLQSQDGKTLVHLDDVGKLTYTRSGNVWALVAGRASRDDAMWYTGTFDVDREAGTVVHHVQYASVPAYEGGDLVRHFRLEGDQLTLSLPLGTQNMAVLTWRKLDRRGGR